MRLLALQAAGFRNLAPLDLATDASFVVVHGPNAQGKTNLLEAIYWLATLKPLRARRAAELIGWDSEAAVVAGTVQGGGMTRRYKVQQASSGRTVQLDGRTAALPEWFEGVRAIAFTPSDGEIVLGGPSERRSWVDRAAFTKAPRHLQCVKAYRRCLEQKAVTLRSGRPDSVLLDALDEQVALAGADLVSRRLDILTELQPRVAALHARIAGGSPNVELRYASGSVRDGVPVVDRLREQLARARPQELRRRTTLVGPQRDDVSVLLDGQPARTFGSRGQVRSLVLALKLAELVAARDRGEGPLFLLDDLSSELDRARTGRLVETLAELDAQVFISTTDPGHLDALPSNRTRYVALSNGVIDGIEGPTDGVS
ncbi:MAG: DNA replication/repair protein RecF [Myxococcota bacterium]